jgi:hypothetical protein
MERLLVELLGAFLQGPLKELAPVRAEGVHPVVPLVVVKDLGVTLRDAFEQRG